MFLENDVLAPLPEKQYSEVKIGGGSRISMFPISQGVKIWQCSEIHGIVSRKTVPFVHGIGLNAGGDIMELAIPTKDNFLYLPFATLLYVS